MLVRQTYKPENCLDEKSIIPECTLSNTLELWKRPYLEDMKYPLKIFEGCRRFDRLSPVPKLNLMLRFDLFPEDGLLKGKLPMPAAG